MQAIKGNILYFIIVIVIMIAILILISCTNICIIYIYRLHLNVSYTDSYTDQASGSIIAFFYFFIFFCGFWSVKHSTMYMI